MMMVAAQPSHRNQPSDGESSHDTRVSPVMTIMTVITGTATTRSGSAIKTLIRAIAV